MADIELPWGRMAYRNDAIGRDGDDTLVLLHGTGGQVEHWQTWLDAMASQGWAGRVINVEFRGHGRSDACTDRFSVRDLAADVAALLAAVTPARPVLVGHSLGGMVALAGEDLWPIDCRYVLIEGWTQLACAARCGPNHHWGQMSADRQAAIRADWEHNVGRFEKATWQAFWRTVEQADARDSLRASTRQALSVYGNIDLPTPVHETMELPDPAAATGSHQLALVEGAGHYTHLEQPTAVATAVIEFLRATSTRMPAS